MRKFLLLLAFALVATTGLMADKCVWNSAPADTTPAQNDGK